MAPYSWTIDDSTRTVFVRGYGEGVTEDTLGLIAELGAELRARPGYDFVYDSTALRIASSPADMIRVAKAMFDEGGMRFRRFALVVPASRVALARIFAALAQPFGVTANVFADEATALEWLAERRERASLDARPTLEPPPAAPRHPPPTFPEAPEIEPEP
ncbi:MAG TPA: hypothetical protein VF039_14500 [Longimicrobiales bacterium]